MFRRGNFASTYMNYAKHVKNLKNKLESREELRNINISRKNIVDNFSRIVDCVKGNGNNNEALVKLNQFKSDVKFDPILNASSTLRTDIGSKFKNVYRTIQENKTIQSAPEKCKETLIVLQKKIDDFSKNNIKREINRNLERKIINRSLFTGAGIFGINSSPVTVTGYSSYDLELLKQLGISPSNNSSATNTQEVVEVVDNSNTTNQISINDQAPMETATNYDSNNFPPSLFDTNGNNQHYQSIFDNMPPEEARNDIYTTISSMFSRPSNNSSVSEDIYTSGVAETNLNEGLEVAVSANVDSHNSTEFLQETLIEANFVDSTDASLTNVSGEIVNLSDVAMPVVNSNGGGGGGESVLTNQSASTNVNLDAGGGNFDSSDIVNVKVSSSIDPPVVEAIPEPPPVPDVAAEIASQLNALGEPTFASLGLGGWSPVGIVQNCLEYLHVTADLPWWGTIAIGTVVIRFMMFPLVVIAQRNAAKMNNHLPQMQVIQLKMTEARQSGNQLEVARYSQELMTFMKEKNVNPFKNMIVPLAQMPVFISFFVGLRQMSNVPVDSLRDGGMLWFQDLTVPDQFFALPIITSLTLWATIELGTDSAKLSSQNLQTMKYVLRALPFVILPFTVNFPGAILCYWVSSNFISLAQVGFLKIPAVRDYFKIDPLLKHDPTKLPVKSKGFVGGIKESWTNLKITKELEERRRLDELQFQKAGKGPLVKTYKYDPTKQVQSVKKGAISAKNR